MPNKYFNENNPFKIICNALHAVRNRVTCVIENNKVVKCLLALWKTYIQGGQIGRIFAKWPIWAIFKPRAFFGNYIRRPNFGSAVFTELSSVKKFCSVKMYGYSLRDWFLQRHLVIALAKWSICIVVSSQPATEETRAMGREIESRHGIWQ
jgi:hypothetical protein